MAADVITYRAKSVTLQELPEVHRHFRELYPDGVASLQRMQSWLKVQPQIVWKVMSVHESRAEVPSRTIGIFELLALNKKGAECVDRGERTGLTILASDLAADPEVPSAYYVGSVGSLYKDRLITAAVLKTFYIHVLSLCRESQVTLYARPVSGRGQNLVDKFSFTKLQAELNDDDSIWRVQLPVRYRDGVVDKRLCEIDFSSFLDELVLECTDGGRCWIVKKTFRLNLPRRFSMCRISVSESFETDFASIPRVFWILLPPTGTYGKAAVVHDYLYRETIHRISRREADDIFHFAMLEKGVRPLVARVMWIAVRLFGGGSWEKR
jgi:hypothetical protein